ncbi:damage-inducible protein DinB [Pusillimonas caeni]|uniref:DinB family protein n=1 Tax=Pusillimonas caeni TaxID=1348472 RepID=UPI000E59EDF2|nr:DinB family protein [Pusillimonas caeni]TFL14798.1 damage-inducible protein DinB [Pusillimonas caeni]
MISKEQIRLLARYNQWMNEKVYKASSELSDQERKADAKANYKSVHSTLNYLLWADYVWLGRFTENTPLAKEYPKGPIGVDLYADWAVLQAARQDMDNDFLEWSQHVSEGWLAADYSWHSVLTDKTITKPAWLLVTHLFNHQADHRGQVITMLKQHGVSAGDSDLLFMPLN